LHERLAKLANRVSDPATIFGQIHARIPMVTPNEQRALQLENAEAAVKLWDGMHDMAAGNAEGHKELAAFVQTRLAADQSAMANAATLRTDAKGRITHIKNGENVAGGFEVRTREEWPKWLSWTASDTRHVDLLHCNA
jgi:hypothetical protein